MWHLNVVMGQSFNSVFHLYDLINLHTFSYLCQEKEQRVVLCQCLPCHLTSLPISLQTEPLYFFCLCYSASVNFNVECLK